MADQHYRIELPPATRVILEYHSKDFAVALKYKIPDPQPLNPGTVYVNQYEVRIPLGSEVLIVPGAADFSVHLTVCGEEPVSTDPISSLFSKTHP